MLNGDDLVAAWVSKLQSIDTLMAVLGPNATISGYMDRFPDQANLRRAILKQPPASILVVYMGFRPRRMNQALYFQHGFQFVLKAPQSGDGTASYSQIAYQMVDGIDPDTGLKLLHSEIHPLCYPMDLDLPSATRQQLLIDVNTGETMDYYEFMASLVECVSDTQ